MPQVTRRQFLIGGASLAAIGVLGKVGFAPTSTAISGSIVGASSSIGHRLWKMDFPEPTMTLHKKIVIIGGGVAGLSAAWQLQRMGHDDFTLLEMEKEVGGNASSGENSVSAYPWGAHYVPFLTEEATEARELFEELGIITGYENKTPIYNEYYISADPHERLYIHGHWQEGLVPQVGMDTRDREHYQQFFAAMDAFKEKRGEDGKRLFAIPVDQSSNDSETRKLDAISFADYLAQNGWNSPYLTWYADYCCRDDYGAMAKDVSAWAGIHYFAARNGKAANADSQSVITWPEGNGWVVKRLKQKLADHIAPHAIAYRVEKTKAGASVTYWDSKTKQSTTIEAEAVIFATPRFIAERLYKTGHDLSELHYSPWMVANITINQLPQKSKGAPLSWDNMVYDSELLGYVNSGNQSLSHKPLKTVLTYYWPLSHTTPSEARKEMLAKPYETWRDTVMSELLRIHPDLKGQVSQLDVWLWGHGMIRPGPDYIWGEARKAALTQTPPIFYAHSDMSGISIFEEANYHGVKAAKAVASFLKKSSA